MGKIQPKISIGAGGLQLVYTRPSLLDYYKMSKKNLDELDELLHKVRAFQDYFINYILDAAVNPASFDLIVRTREISTIAGLLKSHIRLIEKLSGTLRLHLNIVYRDSIELVINASQNDFFFKDFASRTKHYKIYATWAAWDKHIRLLMDKDRKIFTVAKLMIKKRLFVSLQYFYLRRNTSDLKHIYQPIRDLYFSIKLI